MGKKVYNFTKEPSKVHLYSMVNFVFNERLKRITSLVPSMQKNSIILDIGCNRGYFSNILSLKGTTIGLDVFKPNLIEAKQRYPHINFIQADISFLPFRTNSIDLVVCGSVLEHIKNLDAEVKQIKDIIKKRGKIIATYPMEGKFLLTLHRIFNPNHERLINPNKYYGKEFWKVPFTHKQNYSNIRKTLTKHFFLIAKDKMPYTFLPDWLSIYECSELLKE